jgi:MFS family permease
VNEVAGGDATPETGDPTHVFESVNDDVSDAIRIDDTDGVLGPVTHSLVWATWALFVGLGLMLTGAGLFATLLGIRAELDGFPTVAIGVVSASYYLGFLVGSRVALAALGTVGHIRVFAALASVLAATILATGMIVHPVAWIGLRLLSGACLAGQYVVAESWLNQIVTNANRARILSLYSLTTVVAYGVGQLSLVVIDPTTLTAFGIGAVLISLAIAPVTLSEDAAPPIIATPERMSLRELWAIVPTGVVTSTLVGLAHGAFLGLGAVYATKSGLNRHEIGLFVAMPTLGSLLLQIPISAASDDIDRRAVGALAAFTAAGAATVLLVAGPNGWIGYAAMALIGGTTYPLYSIAGAYTNDWIPAEQLTAAASQLVILFGMGAFVGPFVSSIVMSALGASGFVWTTAAIHAAIGCYLTVRLLQWRTPIRAKPWNEVALAGRIFYLPATVIGTGRRFRSSRRVRLPGDD